MAKKDTRSRQYDRLRKKVVSKSEFSYTLDEALYNLSKSLVPQRNNNNTSNNAPKSDKDMDARFKEIQDRYNQRLNEIQRANDSKLSEVEEQSSNSISSIKSRLDKSNEQNAAITNSLKSAIQRLGAIKQQQNPKSEEENEQTSTSGGNSFGLPDVLGGNRNTATVKKDVASENTKPPITYTEIDDSRENVSISEEAAATRDKTVVKKVLDSTAYEIQQKVPIGDYTYRITNLFGIRSGKNSVPGREGRHAGGIDLVSHDADGTKINAPISLTDGKILKVSLNGDGSNFKTIGGRTPKLGYSISVLTKDKNTGEYKVLEYGHLSPDIMKQDMSKLVGKDIKRGDVLFEGNHMNWSGSGTGAHVKVRESSVGEDGTILKNYTDPKNDPAKYLAE